MRLDGQNCEFCKYPGEGTVRCPECEAEITGVLVKEWNNSERTVHCPNCQKIVDRVLEG